MDAERRLADEKKARSTSRRSGFFVRVSGRRKGLDGRVCRADLRAPARAKRNFGISWRFQPAELSAGLLGLHKDKL
jgi:hypothetical protein